MHTEYEDLWGEESVLYSEEVIDAYVHRYATPSRLGREPTDEDFARIHHGGPNGWNSPSTRKYWSQVSTAMMSGITGMFPIVVNIISYTIKFPSYLESFMHLCTHLQFLRE